MQQQIIFRDVVSARKSQFTGSAINRAGRTFEFYVNADWRFVQFNLLSGGPARRSRQSEGRPILFISKPSAKSQRFQDSAHRCVVGYDHFLFFANFEARLLLRLAGSFICQHDSLRVFTARFLAIRAACGFNSHSQQLSVPRESAVRGIEKYVQLVDAPVLAANFAPHELRAQLGDFLPRGCDACHRKFHFNFAWNGFPFVKPRAQKVLCELLPTTLV